MGTPIAVDQVLSVNDWMTGAAAAIEAEADHLTQLDSAIGDGDHGVNMTRGMRAVTAALADAGDVTAPGKRLTLAGKTDALSFPDTARDFYLIGFGFFRTGAP